MSPVEAARSTSRLTAASGSRNLAVHARPVVTHASAAACETSGGQMSTVSCTLYTASLKRSGITM